MNIIVKKFARKFFSTMEVGIFLFVLVVFALKFETVSEFFTSDVIIAGALIFVFLLGHISGRLAEFLYPTLSRSKKKAVVKTTSVKHELNAEKPVSVVQTEVEVIKNNSDNLSEKNKKQLFDMLEELDGDPNPHIIKEVAAHSQEEVLDEE